MASSRCSGAFLLAISAASSRLLQMMISPFFSMLAPAVEFVFNTESCSSICLETFSASVADVVTIIACASESCSACASISAATQAGFALSSAMINTSVGPATKSIPTLPYTWRFASATNLFPGPAITCTCGTVLVPKAIAPTACAPPTAKTRVTPQM